MAHTEKITINGKQLQIPLNNEGDLSVFREVFLDRDYNLLKDLITNATLPILDIGAHIGLFSLYVSALNATVPIYAYEPDEANFRALKENLRLNHVQNVFAKNVAIAGESGTRELHISADSHNHSLFPGATESDSAGPIPGAIKKVPTTSLKDIFTTHSSKFAIPGYSLIKMDCEGAEFEIIASISADQLSLAHAYYLEYHEYQPDFSAQNLAQVFRKAGFKTSITPSRYDSRMGFIFAKK